MPPNNLLQRSENDKVLGRGQSAGVLEQVMRARVLERPRAVAEQGRSAAPRASAVSSGAMTSRAGLCPVTPCR
jgi:hypothetical protein